MYKLFLVEDEVNIRESIRDTIDWAGAGYEYQGEAPDGELALKAIRKCRPDIVITDIRMPFMDGLELAELLRTELPATKVIILSGHGDFAYAQKAIRLGVVEYLLKPVAPVELIQAVNRVAADFRDNFAGGGATASQRRAHQEKQHDFLRQLLSGAVPPSEIFSRVTELGLPFRENSYLVASFRSGGRRVGLSVEVAMLEEIRAICQPLRAVVMEQGKGEGAVIFQEGDDRTLQALAGKALGEFAAHCRDHLQAPVFSGIGAATERLHELSRSLRESETACNFALFTKAAEPVFFSEMHEGEGAPGLRLAECLGRSGEFFQKGELSGVADYAAGIRRAAAEVGGGMGLQYAYLDILMNAGRFLKNLQVEPETVLPELKRLHEGAFGITGPEQLEERVAEICERVVEYRKKHLAGRYHELLYNARDYIESNYANPDLSLQMVAMRVHVSPTHFSAIFSRETGETFSDYLARVRMDNATRLLKTTALSAAEIAKRVGYKDPQYFSRVFKRTSGVSIRMFRAGE